MSENEDKSILIPKTVPVNDKRFSRVELGTVGEGEDNGNKELFEVLTKFRKDQNKKAISMAFEIDPIKTDQIYSSVYRRRTNQVPPVILKRIRDTEELIGGIIIPVRAKQASLFARPRANRFDIGFTINLLPQVMDKFSPAEQEKIKGEIIPQLRDLLINCGKNDGVNDKEKRNLSQTFVEIVEDLLTFGAFAVEVRMDALGKFHSFRARDAGTIYFTTPQRGQGQEAANIRVAAQKVLEQLQGLEVDIAKFQEDEFTYVQVIEDIPRQVFTDKELLYWTNTPSTDILRSGYPVSPIERMLSSITTHLNLTTHNKMYFVNGRATRNMLVFKSENLEESDITAIKAQMVGHINSANAAFRMPVFGMGKDDSVDVVQLDPANRDMEFQYLADLNKRMIFAAYQMSPDEIAALSYLSRGTNSQSMSESNNEWKLMAARDIGLRPLLLSIEDFINTRLLPRINPEWAKLVQINLEGLDADSPEKEATRLQQDSALFLTMNDIMERVEKEDVPLGGNFPLNAAYMQIVEKYFTKGEILKALGGKKYENADKDPNLAYYMGDQAWFTMQQMQQAQQQMQQQQQPQPSEASQELSGGQDLDSAMSQLGESLGKSEQKLPLGRKELLKRHKISRKKIMDAFEKESQSVMDRIMADLSGKKTDDDSHEH